MIQIQKYCEQNKAEIFARNMPLDNVSDIVSGIIKDVKENGDAALYKYCEKFDNSKLSSLEVTKEEWDEALLCADKTLVEIMERAAANIREFHNRQKREGFEIKRANGEVVGQRISAVACAGIYVPGGTAAYPSTVLMDAIPAKVAGVKQIVMVSPVKDGKLNPDVLAAAKIAGVDRVFKIGGAQAIAALALGTESVPKADKIVGPGNAFVAEAKRQIFGLAGIDMVAGPSEILVIADSSADPKKLAADLLSQAEHDKNASAVLITDSMDIATATARQLEIQLCRLPRAEIARASIENNGKIIVTDNLQQAIEVSDELAPEHLELCVESPFEWLKKVNNAGSVFLGNNTPEAIGDYFAGTNHTLPTSGTAKFSSALSVDDFTKKTQYIYYTDKAAAAAADDIAYFAKREGLEAHALSALERKEQYE